MAAAGLFRRGHYGRSDLMIISSTIIEDRSQRDGRRSVTERHVDSTGSAHDVYYLAESNTDVNVAMAARVPQITANLQAAEQQRL